MDDKTASPATMTPQPGGFRRHVGYRTTVWRENYAELVLDLEAFHGNTHGALHGGVYMTVIDAAMGQAATWCPIEGHIRRCVTVSLSATFLRAASGPRIKIVSRLESVANKVAVCRAEVIDPDGSVCATAQGTFRYVKGGELPEGVPGVRADSVEPEV